MAARPAYGSTLPKEAAAAVASTMQQQQQGEWLWVGAKHMHAVRMGLG